MMERDFMGLNPKEELVEGGCGDSVIAWSSGVQWPFSSNVSAFSPLSFKPQFIGGNSITPPASKPLNSSAAQLTIFYNGTMNVFDDISSEKVQAIIFLARNGRVSSNKAQSSQPAIIDTSATKSDTKLFNTPIINSANSIIPSAIPQSRKASLAWFLQKRRERVMNASPYKMRKKPDDSQEDSIGCGSFSSNEINEW